MSQTKFILNYLITVKGMLDDPVVGSLLLEELVVHFAASRGVYPDEVAASLVL